MLGSLCRARGCAGSLRWGPSPALSPVGNTRGGMALVTGQRSTAAAFRARGRAMLCRNPSPEGYGHPRCPPHHRLPLPSLEGCPSTRCLHTRTQGRRTTTWPWLRAPRHGAGWQEAFYPCPASPGPGFPPARGWGAAGGGSRQGCRQQGRST